MDVMKEPGLEMAKGEAAEKELDAFIARRDAQRCKSEGDRAEEDAWRASERRMEASRRAANRVEWYGRHLVDRADLYARLSAEHAATAEGLLGGGAAGTFTDKKGNRPDGRRRSMGDLGGTYLESLKREFEQNRDRVWADEGMTWQGKRPEIERLWREFDRQRNAIRGGYSQGKAEGGASDRAAFANDAIFLRRLGRRPWKGRRVQSRG